MKVRVRLFAQYRQIAKSKEIEINVNGDTMKDIITTAISVFPELAPLLLDEGEIRPYAYIMLNGVRVLGREGMAMKVNEGDDIAMFPPMAGG